MHFRHRVHAQAMRIPKGKVATYGSLAAAARNPRAQRAVGAIMRANDYSKTHVPCHRVINSDGSLGGYNGGIRRKMRLLRREGAAIRKGKIDLRKYGFKF
ncbi:MAG: MGMT family protein [Candidatus Micrarchaeota archaeon]